MKTLMALMLAIMLGGCASIPGLTFGAWSALAPEEETEEEKRQKAEQSLAEKMADKFVKVEGEHRDVRVCLLASAVVEVMTAQVRTSNKVGAGATLGRLAVFQGTVQRARNASSEWFNSDMADVALTFAKVLSDTGQSRLANIILGGLTPSNIIGVAKRAVVFSVKGRAALADINIMMKKLTDGKMTKDAVWDACTQRMDANKAMLEAMSGIVPPPKGQ
jgi:hypothetical protein